MLERLVREIDGHKFYSQVHTTKEDAERICVTGFTPTFENHVWFNFSSSLGYQEDRHIFPKSVTFKNANWTERNYDCTNIVCCSATEQPRIANQRWFECDDSELNGLERLHSQGGIQFFGYM